ncbi:alpha/beta fold hydrolase [Solimonas sp. K1W22B-7]|uniref:alpha/beta fold hydrolase n=1 Tax=Solimonas sp. K1W22B-7 TaxID=2303331 RepID=UPI0013C446AB|nr:alpha/beta hydrolase [Solimonas sp. K1W22B-7]
MTFDANAGYLGLTPTEDLRPGQPAWRGRRRSGSGPTLHFLHGNGFCGGVYWPFLRRFLPQYGLFCSDIEGHGASEAPPRFSGVPAVLERARAVIAAQGLDQAPLIGIGHSFGGALTLRLAAEYPGLFRAVVLLDPIVMPAPMWAAVHLGGMVGRHPMAKAARRRRNTWDSREAAFARLKGRGIYAGWTDEALQSFVDHALSDTGKGSEVQLACPRELEAEIFEQPVWPWGAFRRLQCPALFVSGTGSYGFFPWARRVAQRVSPRTEFLELPGGHCFMQEDPANCHAAVADFLRRQGL